MAQIVTITNPLTGQPAQVDQLEHTAQEIDDAIARSLPGGDIDIALQNKAEFILLWENASPSSDFAAQTVALDLSVYGFIFVEGRGCGVWTCRVGGEARLVTNHSGVLWRTRRFTAYEQGVEFNDAYQGYYSQDGAVSNSDCIPLYIYGIKGVSV